MKVVTKYNPQMEFILSLFVFSNKKLLKKVDLGPKWRKETANSFSAQFMEKIEDEDTQTSLSWIHSCILLGKTNGDTVEELLTWASRTNEDYPLKHPLNNLPEEPPISLTEIHPLLTEWNETYFSKLSPEVFEGLKKQQAATKQLLEQYSEIDVIDKATKGIYLEAQPDDLVVHLIPQYHARPVVIYNLEENTHFYQYSADGIIGNDRTIAPEMLRVQQALSDENRLKILKLLTTGPKTFKAVHHYIKLAKSTVHHHLISLRAAGLVRLHITPGKPDRYSFREQGLTDMESKILNFINFTG